jgi:ribosomal protein S18 acetylase RimI-like enzyme
LSGAGPYLKPIFSKEKIEQDGKPTIILLDEIEASTGEKQAVIFDTAVRKEHRGKYIINALLKKAEDIVRQKGLKYLVGTVSIDNKEALGISLKHLGFTAERVQLVKRFFKINF